MYQFLAAHHVLAQPAAFMSHIAHIAALVAPPAGGSGAPVRLTKPLAIDPVMVGIALVAIGALYALVLLVAVALLHRPRRLKWPVDRQGADEPDGRGAGRPARAHRPLAARRALGAHAPVSPLPPVRGDMRGDMRNTTTATNMVSASAPPSGPGANPVTNYGISAGPDSAAWHPVEYEVPEVGLVHLDARTVRAFAGQPDVLRRLAFQRWRYQAGRCSEFAPRERTAGEGEAPREGRSDPQADPHAGDQGRRGSLPDGARPPAARRARARPPWKPGRKAPVPHQAGGGEVR
jgi:hypothetical protein